MERLGGLSGQDDEPLPVHFLSGERPALGPLAGGDTGQAKPARGLR